MIKMLNKLAALAVIGGAVGTTACENELGLDASLQSQASVSFAAIGGRNLFGDPTPPQNPMTVNGHVISVTNVELRVSEIELEGSAGNKTEIRGSSMVVGVPTNGSVVTAVTATVAAGTFNELEMDVESVRIRGTFDGQPFDLTVRVDEELETRLSPALVITESGNANATVTINIASWFRNSDGTALDLRNASATVLARLAANIEASFEAFGDDD